MISFEIVISFTSHMYLEVEFLGNMIALFLIFWGISILFSIVLHSYQQCTTFAFLYILSNTCHCLFGDSLSDRCDCVTSFVLPICISLMVSDNEYLFIYLWPFVYIYLGLCLFFNWISWGGFAVELYEFFIYFGNLSLIRYLICKFFLPFHRLPFPFVNHVLCFAETLQFDVILLVYFCFYCLCLDCRSHKTIAKINVKELFPCIFF